MKQKDTQIPGQAKSRTMPKSLLTDIALCGLTGDGLCPVFSFVFTDFVNSWISFDTKPFLRLKLPYENFSNFHFERL